MALRGIRLSHALGLSRLLTLNLPTVGLGKKVMGIDFLHPVGLAAGFDKDGEYSGALHGLGFAFVEVGTVTPRGQGGNPRPRVFRLREQRALINRMGFNNRGMEYALGHLERTKRRGKKTGVLGVNIGKNGDTPLERAAADYLAGLRACYDVADYVAVNISSPNTPELRSLQFGTHLPRLLQALKNAQGQLADERGRYVPLAVKISPDLTGAEVAGVSQAILDGGMDGIIATNSTTGRVGVKASPLVDEAGGLSGAPLTDRATWVVQQIREQIGGKLPVIGAGGIMSAKDALNRLRAGADLLQIYTGFVYHGPRLIRDILRALAAEQAKHG